MAHEELTQKSFVEFMLSKGGQAERKEVLKHFKIKNKYSLNNHEAVNQVARIFKNKDGVSIVQLNAECKENEPQEAGDNPVQPETKPEEATPPLDRSTPKTDRRQTPMVEEYQSDDSTSSSADKSSVKQRALALNRLNTEEALKIGNRRPAEGRLPFKEALDKTNIMDSTTLETMTVEQKKWMLASAECNYAEMTQLLKNDPTLANWKNYINGYAALHFAAKFGDTGCIKLLVGTYSANVNVKNHAGHTPLHLAAMHTQEEVIQLLVTQYCADAGIRDYSGKAPKDYLKPAAMTRLQHYFKDNSKKKLGKLDLSPEMMVQFFGLASTSNPSSGTTSAAGPGSGLQGGLGLSPIPAISVTGNGGSGNNSLGQRLSSSSFLDIRRGSSTGNTAVAKSNTLSLSPSTAMRRSIRGATNEPTEFANAVYESFRRKREQRSIIAPSLTLTLSRTNDAIPEVEVPLPGERDGSSGHQADSAPPV